MTTLILIQALPTGYWRLEKSQPIIDKTQTIRLAPDLSKLTDGERKAVAKLIEVGQIFQKLYEEQRHPQALSSYHALEQLDKKTGSTIATQNLLTIYRLFQGPIATTLDNKREPFLPVDPLKPGKNMYPWGITKEAIDQKREDLLALAHCGSIRHYQKHSGRHREAQQVPRTANAASEAAGRTEASSAWCERCLQRALLSRVRGRLDESVWAVE